MLMNLTNPTSKTINILFSCFIYLRWCKDILSSARLDNIDLSSYILYPHNGARITAWRVTSPEYCINSPLIITFKFSDVHWFVQSVRQCWKSRKLNDIVSMAAVAFIITLGSIILNDAIKCLCTSKSKQSRSIAQNWKDLKTGSEILKKKDISSYRRNF
jgi:hypothetical protein